MAARVLVEKRSYPAQLLALKYDPAFPIRGLAVDRETGWVCQLSYTHKVSLAYRGRRKVDRRTLSETLEGRNALTPSERAARLRPLNDLFSMSECALIADVVGHFTERGFPFHPASVVDDVANSIGDVHRSLDFHRTVARSPGTYFKPTPAMAPVLEGLRSSGKSLFLISNSPFWFVDAGMAHNFGPDWRKLFDVVIASAGKPNFYKEKRRPFREVLLGGGGGGAGGAAGGDLSKENISYEAVTSLSSAKVYTEGCLTELIRLVPSLAPSLATTPKNELAAETSDGPTGRNSNVL
jgi:HAD superfamily 5'-nucleotidase-like hydrolase